ncbi:MAG TPA: TRAP transporter substrate-binding protein DctP [Trueperaceae bacterium]
MKRRDFLKRAGAAAAGAGLSPLMFARAQAATFNWGMVTSWPTSLDTLFGGAQYFAETLKTMTDGDVQIEVYPAGAQVGALEVLDAVASGAFQTCHTASYYFIGKDPSHAFFTTIPFGLTPQQQVAWLEVGGGQELWNEFNEGSNTIAFACGNTGAQTGGWFNKEINTPADLQGLKMRFPGQGGQVMAKAGVNVQNLPGGEIFLALDTGVIDAADWVGPYDDKILGIYKAAKYYYLPSWAEPGPSVGAYINLDVYNSLPEDIQTAIRTAAAATDRRMLAQYDARNGQALQELVDLGVELRTFPDEVLATLERYADELNQENVSSNRTYARIYENWSAFRDTIRSWHGKSQYAFDRYVYDQETKQG